MDTLISTSWHSYPKIYALGHAAIEDLCKDEVLVEEKVDGSQFSFAKFGDELKCKSKGKEQILDCPDKMFQKAIDTVISLKDKLHDGWTYRAEYLQKPTHNTLAYDRVPTANLILFDINTGEEKYLTRAEKVEEAGRLGLEIVPVIFQGKLESPDDLKELLTRVSILGGSNIEGVVVKQYNIFGRDGKILLGKYVTEAFKEVHRGEWKKKNPSSTDFISAIADAYRQPARWDKAIQHLRDDGLLTDSPKDIGNLMKAVNKDVLEECEAEIKQALFSHAWKDISRKIVAGLPEWYKEKLMKRQFNENEGKTEEGRDLEGESRAEG